MLTVRLNVKLLVSIEMSRTELLMTLGRVGSILNYQVAKVT